jgi:hypothetical protein
MLLAIGSSNDPNANRRSFGRAAHGLFDPDHPEAIGSLPSVNAEVQDITDIFGSRSQPLVGPNASNLHSRAANLSSMASFTSQLMGSRI